jgi:hypothetical protein
MSVPSPQIQRLQGGAKADLDQKRRTPAWTDRILWRPADGIKQLSYTSANLTASDHKPVVATFGIMVTSLLSAPVSSRQQWTPLGLCCEPWQYSMSLCCGPWQFSKIALLRALAIQCTLL